MGDRVSLLGSIENSTFIFISKILGEALVSSCLMALENPS